MKQFPRGELGAAKIVPADSNPQAPLSSVNAQRALRGPPGSVTAVGGPGGEGADVTFTTRGDSGVRVQRREVKSLSGNSQAAFTRRLKKAATQIRYEGEVLVQVPEGTNAARYMANLRKMPPELLGTYRSVRVTIVDPQGNVLLSEPMAH